MGVGGGVGVGGYNCFKQLNKVIILICKMHSWRVKVKGLRGGGGAEFQGKVTPVVF